MPDRFHSYSLDSAIYDEMFLPDGQPRDGWQRLQRELTDFSDEELANIQERVTRSFSNEGITFTVYGDDEADERIIPIDCIPRLLPAAEWDSLAAGLEQRLRALNLFLQDVYGEARIIADGVIPPKWCTSAPTIALKCAASLRPRVPGSPSAAPTWYAPTTGSVCWRTTCACPPAFPT